MPDSKVEVKACPFCENMPELRTEGNNHTKKRVAEIYCKNCVLSMRVGAIRNTLQWAIEIVKEKWNTRPIANNGVSVDWVKTEEHIHALISINDDSISAAKQVCDYLKAKLQPTVSRGGGEESKDER